MSASLGSLLTLAAMTLAAFGLGRGLCVGLGLAGDDRATRLAWSLGLGWIVAGTVLTLLGFLGLLYVPLIGALTLAAAVVGLGQWATARTPAGAEPPTLEPGPPRWLAWGLGVLVTVVVAATLVSALAPPTAGDALCYHLELPKRYLAEHRLVHLPYSDNSTYPLLAEMWCLWALALDGPAAAQLVHWQMGLLLALATAALATPVLGRPWAWAVGGVALLAPAVNNQMTAPLNDLAAAAMTTLAVAAWWRAVVGDEGRRWYILLGLGGGAALAIKYTALLAAGALVVVWIVYAVGRRARLRELGIGLATAATVAASIAGPWYLRAAWYRGNPFFPFFSEVVSSAQPAPGETLPAAKSPLGRGPKALLLAPSAVTFQPERFGGRAHQLGPLFLAVVPGLAWARRLRGLGLLLALSASYGVAWCLLRQNARFALATVPWLSIAVVWVWMELGRAPRAPRYAAQAAVGAMALVLAAIPLARCHDVAAVALGIEDPRGYLLRAEPSFAIAEEANRLLGPDAAILSQDYRAFYFAAPLVRENVYRRLTAYDQGLAPADLSGQLRAAGFTHLVLVESQGGAGFDPTLARLADAAAAAAPRSIATLADRTAIDPDGGRRRYRLVALR